LRTTALFEPLLHGIGWVTNNMPPADFALVLELFASGILRALIVPHDLCWTLPVRAEMVILMGAQYIESSGHTSIGTREDKQVQSYTRQELVKMQGFAVPPVRRQGSAGGRMFIMCQAEQHLSITRTLSDGLPLESTLPSVVSRLASPDAVRALESMLKDRPAPRARQINRPREADLRKRDMVDLLGWTYFALRAKSNPSWYDLNSVIIEEQVSRLVDRWYEAQDELDRVAARQANGVERRERKVLRRDQKPDEEEDSDEEVVLPTAGAEGNSMATGRVQGARKDAYGDPKVTDGLNGVSIFEVEEVDIGEADGEAL
jgi:antiviral helicase SLH1